MNKTLKSILSLVLCVCFVLALSACGKQNNDTTANNTDTNVRIMSQTTIQMILPISPPKKVPQEILISW